MTPVSARAIEFLRVAEDLYQLIRLWVQYTSGAAAGVSCAHALVLTHPSCVARTSAHICWCCCCVSCVICAQVALGLALVSLPSSFQLPIPSHTPGQEYDYKTVRHW
jgi:hypothetical protein